MDKYETLRLKNQLCFPIYLCSKEITRKYTEVLKEIDLTYTQYVVMMYFWEVGSSNLKEIAKTLMLDSSTLTPLLKKLESKGFIRRERASDDERNLLITLTENGDKLKDKALFVPQKVGSCLNLTEDEAKQLYSLTYKLVKNMQEE